MKLTKDGKIIIEGTDRKEREKEADNVIAALNKQLFDDYEIVKRKKNRPRWFSWFRVGGQRK